jgi:signal transduction histidine kinase
MPETFSTVTTLTIIITTLLLLVLGSIIVYFLFLYQRKRFRHQQELFELRETFNNTLLQSKLEIQEQTLNHISKEIHDHFSPGLWSVKTALKFTLPTDPEAFKKKIDETVDQVQQLYDQMRAISLSLNTDQIMRVGLRQSLQNELNRLNKIGQYETNLSVKGGETYIEPEKAIILFRMCQEVLNNIVKHADAVIINIVMDFTGENILLNIGDNGTGFDLKQTLNDSAKTDSTGLRNIFNRARLIEAVVDIKTNPGEGTEIIITFPKTKDRYNASDTTPN